MVSNEEQNIFKKYGENKILKILYKEEKLENFL